MKFYRVTFDYYEECIDEDGDEAFWSEFDSREVYADTEAEAISITFSEVMDTYEDCGDGRADPKNWTVYRVSEWELEE